MTPIAHLALAEFTRRKASVDEAVARGRFPRRDGETLVGCWLAIALECGVPVRRIDPLREWWASERKLPDCYASHIVLRQCPPAGEWKVELARARDAVAARARALPTDRDLQDRDLALQMIAIHLGVDPERPETARQPEREAA